MIPKGSDPTCSSLEFFYFLLFPSFSTLEPHGSGPIDPEIFVCTNVNLHNIIDLIWFDLIFGVLMPDFQQYFSYIMATSFSGGGSRSTLREPSTMGKQLVNFITCGCESRTPFFCNLQSRARTHAVLVIGLYELLDPTT